MIAVNLDTLWLPDQHMSRTKNRLFDQVSNRKLNIGVLSRGWTFALNVSVSVTKWTIIRDFRKSDLWNLQRCHELIDSTVGFGSFTPSFWYHFRYASVDMYLGTRHFSEDGWEKDSWSHVDNPGPDNTSDSIPLPCGWSCRRYIVLSFSPVGIL